MEFIKKALSEQDGTPSSKRITAAISALFFILIMIFILVYFVRVGGEVTAIERNLPVILGAAAGLPTVMQGLTLFQKNAEGV